MRNAPACDGRNLVPGDVKGNRIMKKLVLLVAIFAAISAGNTDNVNAQTFYRWVNQAGGTDSVVKGYGLTMDVYGNSIVTGKFTGTCVFGETNTLHSGGASDIFIAKYDQSGDLVWVRQAGGTSDDEGYGIATDGAGNIIVTGKFQGDATFGQTVLASRGESDIFIAKYDTAGSLLWVRQAGGAGDDQGLSVAVDGIGYIVVTGSFRGEPGSPAIFDGESLYSSGGTMGDIFIARYDGDGKLVWVQKAGGPDHDEGLGVATDSCGNNIITGRFGDSATGSATFGTGTTTETTFRSSGGSDIFIAKYDVNGNLVWARQAGGTGDECSFGIATDVYGNSIITGRFKGTASFGETVLTSRGGSDIFIARYDVNGNPVWARQAGGVYDDLGQGISADRSGNILVTGEFHSRANFGQTSVKSTGGSDIFLAKYDMNGNLLWVEGAGGRHDDCGSDVAVDPGGSINMVGSFRDTATFGALSLASHGAEDAFVLKMGIVVGDINGDDRIGLEEAIHALQVISRIRGK